jgi:hypothetical protein
MCGYEDGWNPAMLSVQLGLQFQTGPPCHVDIRDQARGLMLLVENFLDRRICEA